MYKVNKGLFFKILTLLSLMILYSPVISVSANQYSLESINIRPVFTETQDKLEDGFFSINSGSNDVSEELIFEISNGSEDSITLDIRILNAYTSPSGVIQYESRKTEDSLILEDKFEMKRYIEGPENITINPGENKNISFHLESTKVDGQVLGGIAFVPPVETSESDSFLEIRNEVRVIYGVMMNGENISYKGISLKKPYIEPMPSYYVIRYPIENNSNSLIKDMKMDYVVEDMKENIIFDGLDVISMAPKTRVHAEIPFDNDEIKVNTKYRIKGTMEFEFNEETITIEFNEVFKYRDRESALRDSQERKEITSANEVGIKPWMYIALGSSVMAVLLLILIYFKSKDEAVRAVKKAENTRDKEDILSAGYIVDKLDEGRKKRKLSSRLTKL